MGSATLFVALSRFYALAPAMWDWDEAQFAAGVREYDSGWQFHHPHPPGFPIFIALGKLVRFVVRDDFRALQCVTLIAAMTLLPLAFFVARALRFSFATSLLGALLFAFLPNVWFFGGTAFSDVLGLALTLAAIALLLYGREDARSFLCGALVLGLAAGVRPQAVLFGAAPFAVAAWAQWRESWRRVLAACAIVTAVVVISYVGAALATSSIEAYVAGVQGLRKWNHDVDSFTSATRAPMTQLLAPFFVRPFGGGRIGAVISILALLGLARGVLRRERGEVLLLALTFVPFGVVSLLSLDPNSIHRYSIAYAFPYALLAAHALAPFWKWPRAGQIAVLLAITLRCGWWTAGALADLHRHVPPTGAASRELQQHARHVWLNPNLRPFGEYFLVGRYTLVSDSATLWRTAKAGDAYATEGALDGATVFAMPRGRLWDITRHRYFEVSVLPVGKLWQFGRGWYAPEPGWRWMDGESETMLPALEGRGRLRLTIAAQERITPQVEVWLNGALIERFRCSGEPTTKEWIVNARGDAPNQLIIRSSETVMLPTDPRALSVMLRDYDWAPLRE
ncbi:MAG TPA: hypothetical protein VFN10_02285 [Thermoanaerobaculia bacterium]|nr:hypothetical protein [Thermoanaerobaculia bacterium]